MIGDVAQRHTSLGGNLPGGQVGIAHPLQTAQGRLNNLTATVTALSDCELLVVSSADFLGAVTSTPDGEGLAHEISAARLELDRGGR